VHRVLVKNNKDIVNEAKQPIKISIAYDSRAVGEQKWVGVVLRNLPADASAKGIL